MGKLILAMLLISTLAFSDDDDYYYSKSSAGVKPVSNELYKNECGSCHFAFQAGLLPKRSWVKMMDGLENHFGTDATIDTKDFRDILAYLSKEAADNATEYKRSRRMNNSIKSGDTPIKITDVSYFIRKHHELSHQMITQKEVGTLSNCISCHTTADKGIYSERAIRIPNYGRWDD